MESYKIEDFVNTHKSIEKVNNPTIDKFYKHYISGTVSEQGSFLEFLKMMYMCPYADNWDIVFRQCFDYWTDSDSNVWNSETLYKVMCIICT